MKRPRHHSIALLALLLLAVAGLITAGCSALDQRLAPGMPGDQGVHAAPESEPEVGGAQLWAQKCSQCHYPRDAGTFSQDQWEIIMLHMRVRANLTPDEHQRILEFLKSAN